MTNYVQGSTQALSAQFFASPGVPVAVTGLSTNVISLESGDTVLAVTGTYENPSLGLYIYQWAVPIDLAIGQYSVVWMGFVDGSPIFAEETINVVSPGDGGYVPGSCQTWPIKWPANCTALATASPEITGIALEAAQDMLFLLSGQRFAQCAVKLRPCREECGGGIGYGWGWRADWWGGWGGWAASYPYPVNMGGGNWINLGCGACGANCSCTPISETFLPGPVASIVEVKVDGQVLIPDIDYRVDDYRKLVRLGAQWPRCNDLNLDDSQPDTWSVTAVYGEPVPMLGQLAVGELACNFLSFLVGEECQLPDGITDLSRQGITMAFANTSEDLTQMFARFPKTYLFLKTYNPYNLQSRAKAYDLDGPTYRAVETA